MVMTTQREGIKGTTWRRMPDAGNARGKVSPDPSAGRLILTAQELLHVMRIVDAPSQLPALVEVVDTDLVVSDCHLPIVAWATMRSPALP